MLQVVTLKSQVNAYRAEAEKQHIAAEGTLESLQAVADERDALNASLQATSCERDALKDQLGSLQQKIDHIVTTQLAEALKQISKMQSDHDEEVKSLRTELERQVAYGVKEMDATREEGQRLLQDALSSLQVSEASLAQKEADLQQAVQTLLRLENEMKQSEQERAEQILESQNSTRRLEIEHNDAIIKIKEVHAEEKNELTLRMEVICQDLRDQLQSKERELHEAEKILADSKSALVEMEQTHSKLQEESEQVKHNMLHDSKKKHLELSLEIEKLQTIVEENREQFRISQQELSSKAGMVEVLEQALSSLNTKIEEVNLDLKKRSEDIIKLQDDVHKKEQDIELLIINKEQLKEALDKQSRRFDSLQDRFSQEEKLNSEKSSRIQELQVLSRSTCSLR